MKRIKRAVLVSSLVDEPFIVLYTMLPFIMHKCLSASSLEIAILISLKPSVAVFSYYWSAWTAHRSDRLKANLIGAEILSRLPFFFIPWIPTTWYLILASAIYMFFHRAAMPAWMEILKLSLPGEKREKLFSFGMSLGYAEGALLGVSLGALLDGQGEVWPYLMMGTALLGLVGIALKLRIQIPKIPPKEKPAVTLLTPWREMIALMKSRPDFARFQWAFMACGFGIMFCLPALPQLLDTSFKNLASARTIFYALGFIATSPLWARLLSRIPVRHFASLIFLSFALYHLLLFKSLFGAFLLYGVSQAGSRLLWHLSGPLFAKEEDSIRFSGVNVMAVGIRGMIAPALGSAFCAHTSPTLALGVGISFCLFASFLMLIKVPVPLRQVKN